MYVCMCVCMYVCVRDIVSTSVSDRVRYLDLLCSVCTSLVRVINREMCARDMDTESARIAEEIRRCRNALKMIIFALSNALQSMQNQPKPSKKTNSKARTARVTAFIIISHHHHHSSTLTSFFIVITIMLIMVTSYHHGHHRHHHHLLVKPSPSPLQSYHHHHADNCCRMRS